MKHIVAASMIAVTATSACWAYPIDGYDHTHIRRIEAARMAQTGEMRGRILPPGTELPDSDPALTVRIRAALGNEAALYNVALLDLSDADRPRYAGHNDRQVANVGSVGKMLVLYGLLDQLARLYPDDTAARERVHPERLERHDRAIESRPLPPARVENAKGREP